MRPRNAITPNKAKGKSQSKARPASSASDNENEFATPTHDDETDYGLDFTSSQLATPRRLPSSTMNRSQKTQRRPMSSTDNVENQPPRTSPRRRSAEQKSQKNSQREMDSYDDDDDDDNDDDDDDAENTPLETLSKRQSSQHSASQQKVIKTKSNISLGKQPQAAAPPAAAPIAPPRRKQRKPEHRMIRMQRDIRRLQESTAYMIPRLPFSRLVRDLMAQHTISTFKITVGALEALQTSTEMYLTQRFEDAYLLTKYRGRVTLEVRDMALVAYFCRTYGNN